MSKQLFCVQIYNVAIFTNCKGQKSLHVRNRFFSLVKIRDFLWVNFFLGLSDRWMFLMLILSPISAAWAAWRLWNPGSHKTFIFRLSIIEGNNAMWI